MSFDRVARRIQPRLEVRCASAAELIAALRLTNTVWGSRPSNRWAFRGQADAAWGLVPKAFRPSTNLAYTGTPMHPPLDPEDQRRAELRLVNYFLFLADRVGLPIPGDGQHLRLPDTLQRMRPSFDDWPWPGVLEILAIAQHHGVPTRLLDFTHDPMTAAFFAAHGALEAAVDGADAARQLAVWAVDLRSISGSVEVHRERGEKPPVIWVTASRAGNTFLHQQDALFLLDLDAESREFPPDLEQAIVRAPARAGLEPAAEPIIVRHTLAYEHTPELLRLLWNENYPPAQLMPTYDNVVRPLEFRRDMGF
jgi:hypothetical protein